MAASEYSWNAKSQIFAKKNLGASLYPKFESSLQRRFAEFQFRFQISAALRRVSNHIPNFTGASPTKFQRRFAEFQIRVQISPAIRRVSNPILNSTGASPKSKKSNPAPKPHLYPKFQTQKLPRTLLQEKRSSDEDR